MRIAIVLCLALLGSNVQAQSDSGGFYLEPLLDDWVIGYPSTVIPTGTDVLYVAQWTGFVKVILPDGQLQQESLIDLFGEVYVEGDRGLVGVTLHPDFPATPYIYLFYPVDDLPGPRPESRFRAYSRLVRYTIDDTYRSVVPDSRLVLLGATPEDGIVSCYNSHSADSIVFGHDGALYVGHGDASSWVEPDAGGLYPECFDGTGLDPSEDIGSFRAQDLNSLSGKVLRLDPETGLGLPDNPFWTGDGSDPESKVWASGLRNPFRMALLPEDPDNPGQTEMMIGDVGGVLFEELNLARGGENFGWPCIEGPSPNPAYTDRIATDGTGCSTLRPGTLTSPWAYFSHTDPQASAPAGRIASSITGGAIYQGGEFPDRFDGMLFFADYSNGWIAAGRVGLDGLLEPEEVIADAGGIVDLSYDPVTQTLYTVDIANSRISRVRFSGADNAPPVARGMVSEPFGELPHLVEFTDGGSFDPAGGALTYSWSFGDGNGAEGETVTHTYESPGSYAATLTVTATDGRVAQSVVRVSVGISLPTLEILSPTTFVTSPSGRFSLDARATDSRNEVLDVFWEIDLVHNSHEHRSFNRVDGPTGDVIAASHAGPGEVAFYRGRAVVIDQEGLRIERVHTIRSYDAAEIGVAGSLAPDEGDAVLFANAIELGRISVPTDSVTGPLSLEVLDDDGWRPARQPHVLTEADTTQVIFASEYVRGVRLTGADAASLVAFPRFDPDTDLGVWDPADAGTASEGRTNVFGDDGLVLTGAGSFQDGTYHTARQVVTDNAIVVARLDALVGDSSATAGVAMHTGLGEDARGLTIGRSLDGQVRTWKRDGARVTESSVSIEDAEWFRIRRQGGSLVAEASVDGQTWIDGGTIRTDGSLAHIAGPVVAGGTNRALAWFGSVALLDNDVDTPDSGSFAVRPLFPNPGRGEATFRVEAGVPGTYVAQVIDARGRVVLTLDPQVVVAPELLEMSFNRASLSQGVYYVQVRNLDLGDSRRIQFVTVR